MTEVDETKVTAVSPVNRLIDDTGTKYVYEYTHGDVHVEDVPEDYDCGVDGAEFFWDDGNLWYQYGDRPEVLIREDGAYRSLQSYEKAVSQQAYYALSILDSDGYVSRFRKK